MFAKKYKEYSDDPKPRLIQNVSNYFKAIHGYWFYAYQLVNKFVYNCTEQFYFAFGAKTDEINHWITKSFYKFDSVVISASDAKAYDSTQNEMLISSENGLYMAAGYGTWINHFWERSLDPVHLLEMKRTSISYGPGITLKLPGTRRTGDVDTTIGNSILMMRLYLFFFIIKNYPLDKVRLAVAGDDNLCFFDKKTFVSVFKSHSSYSEQLIAFSSRIGPILKVHVSEDIEDIDFLSNLIYPCLPDKHGNRFHLGKKPGRTLARLPFMMFKSGLVPKDWDSVMLGNLISLAPLAAHVPFLRVYISHCRTFLGNHPIFLDIGFNVMEGDFYEPDDLTWAFFSKRYGLTRVDEINFLNRLKATPRWSLLDDPSMRVLHSVDFN